MVSVADQVGTCYFEFVSIQMIEVTSLTHHWGFGRDAPEVRARALLLQIEGEPGDLNIRTTLEIPRADFIKSHQCE